MTSVVIGSVALKMHGIDLSREHADIDVLCEQSDYDRFLEKHKDKIISIQNTRRGHAVFLIGSKPVEFEIAYEGSTGKWLLNYILYFHNYKELREIKYADPFVIYNLKMTHRYLKNTPYFKKTMEDIKSLRRLGIGELCDSHLTKWFVEREKETLNYKHPNLSQTKTDFFSEGDFYVYCHDSLHRAVAINDKPAYLLFKEEGEDVKCSKELWDKLHYTQKINAGHEEAMVLALERHQIPNEFKVDETKSFEMALEKICTSITSGYFREFCWNNYDVIMGEFNAWRKLRGSYVSLFKKALKAGEILPFEGKKVE